MPSKAPLQFGDIILVQFPFTNQTTFKQRPAVVVSSSKYNLSRPDVVLMAITSKLGSSLSADDVPVDAWKAAGLLKPSSIKPLFATMEQALIVRPLGALQPADIAALRVAIARFIG